MAEFDVTACEECPLLVLRRHRYWHCQRKWGRPIVAVQRAPSWCPLRVGPLTISLSEPEED